jgi:hypothetical protein
MQVVDFEGKRQTSTDASNHAVLRPVEKSLWMAGTKPLTGWDHPRRVPPAQVPQAKQRIKPRWNEVAAREIAENQPD